MNGAASLRNAAPSGALLHAVSIAHLDVDVRCDQPVLVELGDHVHDDPVTVGKGDCQAVGDPPHPDQPAATKVAELTSRLQTPLNKARSRIAKPSTGALA